MTELKDKYSFIAPRDEFITDYVILAQAWKKTQRYIRRHNWYADVLELDCSTINIEKKLEEWRKYCKRIDYKPGKMKVVPAPKNAQWDFFEEKNIDNNDTSDNKLWGSIREAKLRPLAHLNIRDQTIATAALLCLADAVETEQGSSEEENFLKAQKQQVFSYGNRLHCEWLSSHDQKKQAKFGWGNSQLYRRFYEDYRLFLSRPKEICQYIAPKLTSYQNLFIVHIDLKGFFDNIDRDALWHQLKIIYDNYVKTYKLGPSYKANEEFWIILRNIFKWSWETPKVENNIFEDDKLPEGLPQGLVASGFLSNAYMSGFDKKIGRKINEKIENYIDLFEEDNEQEIFDMVLRDYCRYVDDLRLVIETNDIKDTDNYKISKVVTRFVDKMLEEYLKEIDAKVKLKINEEKTKVSSFRQTSTQNNVSTLMTVIQGVFSGTPDIDSLQQVAGGLDGLLQVSQQLLKEQDKRTNWLELSRISRPNVDVRDDTLKRFAATRIAKSLKIRRGMTDLEETLGGGEEAFLKNVTSGVILDHEFETTARKLIACWASNPSLTLLLRCGLDLYPDKNLLDMVLEALEFKLFPNQTETSNIKEIKTIEYVVADLFRAGAVDIGFRSEVEYPSSVDISSFRQELASFAKRILIERPISPWYVKQQALLFLASIGDTVEIKEKRSLGEYMILHKAMLYQAVEKRPVIAWFPTALIVQQLHPNSKKFAQWFVQLINELSPKEQHELIELIALNRSDLLEEIKKSRRAKGEKWLGYIPRNIDFTSSNELKLFNNEKVSLLRVIQSNKNHFTQENALLLLAYKILKMDDIEKKLKEGLAVKSITVKCSDWGKIQQLDFSDNFLEIEINSKSGEVTADHKLYELPSWVNKEKKWLYGLGTILRSCVTGEFDFTATSFLSRDDVGRYAGLRSTWYSRRFGLINSPIGLNKNQDPISPWLSELLIRLLQWPGISIYGDLLSSFEEVGTAGDLLNIIIARIQYQQSIFGNVTGTPVYEIPTISYQSSDDSMFRIAIVQTLLPKVNHFIDKDPTHWTPSFRAQHRAHIASVCNLIRLKLKAWCKAQNRRNKDIVDLIVFPELSIHPDDLWLLRRLSDSTKASIFAGMTFFKHEVTNKPVNQAIWILRSEKRTGREFIEVRQGKHHMTEHERIMGIQGFRPYQVLVKFKKGDNEAVRVAGAICYDATDLALVADLRDVSDVFVVSALNKDVQTFDNMVGALHYHMYQPVILANSGEFGGSTAQAPFTKHERLIAHVHGQNQIAVSVFELDPTIFKKNKQNKAPMEVKTSPAGYIGRN
ncbi:reverse transcriptase domain-containing protein [Paenibacillus terrae]|uniref:Reverse transcriptase domain-containing protein n=1 Tax=Paenibacillus terrae TaxID=159743 RepID=A0A0D7WTI4_9BACL|nr:reverse transcriptase domain-containing protein [Paenibacillus terrae]KJD42304.1 hypothetical protein QD47_29030 [Paenibacillus terrae]